MMVWGMLRRNVDKVHDEWCKRVMYGWKPRWGVGLIKREGRFVINFNRITHKSTWSRQRNGDEWERGGRNTK